MKRKLSIFMPLFPLPVFWFGYFDGFKTGSRSIIIMFEFEPGHFVWIFTQLIYQPFKICQFYSPSLNSVWFTFIYSKVTVITFPYLPSPDTSASARPRRNFRWCPSPAYHIYSCLISILLTLDFNY